MKKIISKIFVILVLFIILSGCTVTGGESLSGKYVDENNSDEYIDFDAIGTLTAHHGDNVIEGVYHYDTDTEAFVQKKMLILYDDKIVGGAFLVDDEDVLYYSDNYVSNKRYEKDTLWNKCKAVLGWIWSFIKEHWLIALIVLVVLVIIGACL